MKLTEYLRERPDRKRHLAAKLGVTPGALTHWCSGLRSVDPAYWREIERHTNGDVTVGDLLDAVVPRGEKDAA